VASAPVNRSMQTALPLQARAPLHAVRRDKRLTRNVPATVENTEMVTAMASMPFRA